MSSLSRAASRAYLQCTNVSYECGQIAWTILLDRIRFLTQECSPGDPSGQYARRILATEQQDLEDNWLLERADADDAENGSDSIGRLGAEEDDDDFVLYFIADIPGLKQWHFHLADADFFPSVPHGHENGRSQPKLDSYLGWVYRGSEQIRREKRKTIVRLWNDDGFRDFARAAINYYLETYPHYSGWRVRNPARLPRKRKR